MITVVKETKYFHPDMHLHTQGMTQDDIMNEFAEEMITRGVVAKPIKIIESDGKEYITHIQYTGKSDIVKTVCEEHDVIELETIG